MLPRISPFTDPEFRFIPSVLPSKVASAALVAPNTWHIWFARLRANFRFVSRLAQLSDFQQISLPISSPNLLRIAAATSDAFGRSTSMPCKCWTYCPVCVRTNLNICSDMQWPITLKNVHCWQVPLEKYKELETVMFRAATMTILKFEYMSYLRSGGELKMSLPWTSLSLV